MLQLTTLLFDLILFSGYFLLVFSIMILTQLISYRIFNFNLYKKLMYLLIYSQIK